jgi:flagellar hook-associated protein 2
MQLTQSAQDARVAVNGLEVSAAGNRLEGVIENVTIELRRVTPAPVEVTVASDAASLRGSIDAFVKAYNDLNSLIADQTRYDPATKAAGPLQGNQVAVRMQQQLRETLRATVGDGAMNSLNALGIELQRDGSLSVKETKIEAALASPGSLQDFFAAPGEPPGEGGLARRLVERLGGMLDAEGTIPNATEALRARVRAAEQQQERVTSRLGEIEKRLLRQYTALDANLARISGSFAGIQGLFDSGSGKA